MHWEQRRQIFLAKAKEADVKAERARDPFVRKTLGEIAGMYRELAHLESPASSLGAVADRPLKPKESSSRKLTADRKPAPQRIIRIYKRADGTYVSRNEVKTERALGVDASLSDALMTAKRQAALDSRRGYRVVIEVQDAEQSWRQIDVIEPPRN